jgi:hypothetical protein
MADVEGNLRSALEAVASGEESTGSQESESSTGEEKVEAAQATEASEAESTESTKGQGAQQRIQQLVSQRNELTSELEDLKKVVGQRDEELSKLVDVIESRDHDHNVVQKLNELHQDPKYTDMIETLDKAIRGIEEEVETGKATPEEGKQALKVVEQARDELKESIADERAELVLDRAFDTLDKYFNQLVQETEGAYNDEDLKVLREAAVERIDWERLEGDASDLPDVIHSGLQKAVDWYGTPRGALANESNKNTDEGATEGSRQQEPSLTDVINKDWGKMSTVKDAKGEESKEPTVSDADFSSALAFAIRKNRES